MKYLISGHPRTRSAWLCALLNAHNSLCYHDAVLHKIPLTIDAGISDPGVACLYPHTAIRYETPKICLLRDDWQAAMEAWVGQGIDSAEEWNENVEIYRQGAIELPAAQLEDNDTVKEVLQICTGKAASMELIKIFQGLRIEQHLPKAQSIWSISQSVSIH